MYFIHDLHGFDDAYYCFRAYLGSLGDEWKDCAGLCLGYLVFALTNIPEEERSEERLGESRTLWLALAALSVLDETLINAITVTKVGGELQFLILSGVQLFYQNLITFTAEGLEHNNNIYHPPLCQDSSSTEFCENHDDNKTRAIITCNKCGYLCAECDKVMHLSRKSKSHQRQVLHGSLDIQNTPHPLEFRFKTLHYISFKV